jgi:hypothetical protein
VYIFLERNTRECGVWCPVRENIAPEQYLLHAYNVYILEKDQSLSYTVKMKGKAIPVTGRGGP